jgi:hypothetical protein
MSRSSVYPFKYSYLWSLGPEMVTGIGCG